MNLLKTTFCFIKNNLTKILFSFFGITTLVIIMITSLTIKAGFHEKVRRDTNLDEQTIYIEYDTRRTNEVIDVYNTLLEKYPDYLITPIVSETIGEFPDYVSIYGTTNNVFQTGILKNKKLQIIDLIAGNANLDIGIVVTKKIYEKSENDILGINGESFLITGIIDTFEDEEIIIMDYKVFSNAIRDISSETVGGATRYDFPFIAVNTLNDITDVILEEIRRLYALPGDYMSNIGIMTKDLLIERKINDAGMNNDFFRFMMTFFVFSSSISIILIIIYSYNLRKKEFVIRQTLGAGVEYIVLMFLISNVIVSLLSCMSSLIIGSILGALLSGSIGIPIVFIEKYDFIFLIVAINILVILISIIVSISKNANNRLHLNRRMLE